MTHYFQTADIILCDDATDSENCDPFVPIGTDYTDNTSTRPTYRLAGATTVVAMLSSGYGSTVGPASAPAIYSHGGCSAM